MERDALEGSGSRGGSAGAVIGTLDGIGVVVAGGVRGDRGTHARGARVVGGRVVVVVEGVGQGA